MLSIYRAGEMDPLENLDEVHIRLLVDGESLAMPLSSEYGTHKRQALPDSGLGFQINVIRIFTVRGSRCLGLRLAQFRPFVRHRPDELLPPNLRIDNVEGQARMLQQSLT